MTRSLAQQARVLQSAMDDGKMVQTGPGLYYHLLPPAKPSLRDLVIRARDTSATLTANLGKGDTISDEEYCRLDEAAFDARADLRAEFMNMGLERELIDQLGGLL